MFDNKVYKRMCEHERYAKSLGYDIVFMSIYGAQNYGVETPESDVDSYCVVMPSLEDLALRHAPVSSEIEYRIDGEPTGEHIVIKDIRIFKDALMNGDIQALEAAYSEYFCRMYCEDTYFSYGEIFDGAMTAFYYRVRNDLQKFISSGKAQNLNWDLKKDRKSFLRIVNIYHAAIKAMNHDNNPFELKTDTLRHFCVKIKTGEVSKERALATFNPSQLLYSLDDVYCHDWIPFYTKEEVKKELDNAVIKLFKEKFEGKINERDSIG